MVDRGNIHVLVQQNCPKWKYEVETVTKAIPSSLLTVHVVCHWHHLNCILPYHLFSLTSSRYQLQGGRCGQ